VGEAVAKEVEVAYYNINRDDIVRQLRRLGAKFVGKYLQKRINFQVVTRGKAGAADYYTSWIRVREKNKKVTLTLKEQKGNKVTGRREYEVEVSDFATMARILYKLLNNPEYDYFENYREEYSLLGTKITIDKFPSLPYIMEIEGATKKSVDSVLHKLKIKGEPDPNKSVPTAEYYRIHGHDYKPVQEKYKKKLETILKGLK